MAYVSRVKDLNNNTYDIKAKELASQSKTISNVAIASFSDGADNVPVSELIVNITATQAGSGTPSPSNPRAISGWSSCNIHKTGINLWNEDWELGNIDDSGQTTPTVYRIRTKDYIPCKPSTTYYFKSGLNIARLFYYDENKTFISLVINPSNSTFTTPNNCSYLKFRSTDNVTSYDNSISINYPSTDTSYHAYNGTTYPISLGDTYYGGTLNVTTGVMTIINAIGDMGDLTWTYNASSLIGVPCFISNNIDDHKAGSSPVYCSCFEIKTPNRNAINGDGQIAIANSTNSHAFVIRYDEYTDGNDVKTVLTGQKVVYELENPVEIQLTPTEVRTLLEDNNIFADTGDVNKLVYFKTGCESITDIINVMTKPTYQTVTLAANSWNSSTHLITVSVAGVTATSVQDVIGLPATSSANISNNEALQDANIMDAGQSSGTLTFYAENVPTTDLQIRVIVRG